MDFRQPRNDFVIMRSFNSFLLGLGFFPFTSISIMNNLWKFEKINLEKKDNFFILKDEEIDNSSSYFLSPETNEIKFNSQTSWRRCK